jgi:hypothetical protein
MIYGLELCSSFAVLPTTGGNSVCWPIYVFVFSTALPLRAPLPTADTVVTVVTLPHAHLRAHGLPNIRLSYPISPSIKTGRLKYARL